MSGVLLKEATVLHAMEENIEGIFIPAKLDKKTQKLKGDFISIKNLEALAEKIENLHLIGS